MSRVLCWSLDSLWLSSSLLAIRSYIPMPCWWFLHDCTLPIEDKSKESSLSWQKLLHVHSWLMWLLLLNDAGHGPLSSNTQHLWAGCIHKQMTLLEWQGWSVRIISPSIVMNVGYDSSVIHCNTILIIIIVNHSIINHSIVNPSSMTMWVHTVKILWRLTTLQQEPYGQMMGVPIPTVCLR
jgi:hypothetical protein